MRQICVPVPHRHAVYIVTFVLDLVQCITAATAAMATTAAAIAVSAAAAAATATAAAVTTTAAATAVALLIRPHQPGDVLRRVWRVDWRGDLMERERVPALRLRFERVKGSLSHYGLARIVHTPGNGWRRVLVKVRHNLPHEGLGQFSGQAACGHLPQWLRHDPHDPPVLWSAVRQVGMQLSVMGLRLNPRKIPSPLSSPATYWHNPLSMGLYLQAPASYDGVALSL
mmetsp:Transcript_11242/g.27403  ORF Transcript_11242/g.27403 Transcript_11242/m.27403 type:complete len:227 (+) Transcript_11242:622-1302(+)